MFQELTPDPAPLSKVSLPPLDALLTSVRAENGLGQHYLDPNHPAVRVVVEVAKRENPASVLDLACGRGLTSIALVEEAGIRRVVATEINQPGLDELSAVASSRALPIETRAFNAASPALLPEWKGSFEMVVAKDLYPFLSPSENERFVANASEALKPDGVLIFTAPNADSRLFREGGATSDPFYRKLSDDQKQFIQTSLDHFSFATKDQLTDLLSRNGIKLEELHAFGREGGWMTAVARKV